jgi:hypothetical protein
MDRTLNPDAYVDDGEIVQKYRDLLTSEELRMVIENTIVNERRNRKLKKKDKKKGGK